MEAMSGLPEPIDDFLLNPLFGKAVLVAAGLLFTVLGAVHLVSAVRAARRAVKVPGVVTALRPGLGGDSDTTTSPKYAAVLAFRTVDGRDVQTECTEATNPPVAQPGQRVRVAYDPDDPTDAHVDSIWGGGMLVPALALVFGLIVLVAFGLSLLGDLT